MAQTRDVGQVGIPSVGALGPVPLDYSARWFMAVPSVSQSAAPLRGLATVPVTTFPYKRVKRGD
jgi:hypothetical protein